MQEQETAKTSKINSGMLQMYRLDYLWKQAAYFATSGQYAKWNDILDRVWMELGGDVREGDDNEENYKELSEKYAKAITPIEKQGFEDMTQNDLLNLVKQKKALMEKELFLRRLQNNQGKGTAYDEEDDDFD